MQQKVLIIISLLLVSKQWGEWVNGKNTFPIAFTSFYRIISSGEYSFNDNDNAINNVSNLSYFNAQKRHGSITHYLAIGK